MAGAQCRMRLTWGHFPTMPKNGTKVSTMTPRGAVSIKSRNGQSLYRADGTPVVKCTLYLSRKDRNCRETFRSVAAAAAFAEQEIGRCLLETSRTECVKNYVCGNGMPSGGQFLYIMQSGEHVKIGVSGDPLARLSGVQTGNPESVHLLYVFKPLARKASWVEGEVHKTLRGRRVRGEWFAVTPEEAMDAVRRLLPTRIELVDSQEAASGRYDSLISNQMPVGGLHNEHPH